MPKLGECRPILQRLLAKLKPSESGCWEWSGYVHRTGYGKIWDHNRRYKVSAHIAAYEVFVGPVLENHELHHTCNNKKCCNPDHLLCLTHREHMTKYHPNKPRGYHGRYIAAR